MIRAMKQLGVLLSAVVLIVAAAVPAFAGEGRATGLDRAREVAAEGFHAAKGLANNPNADATGRQRAAEAIAAALGRGNGNGNAFGRGHSGAVHAILAEGGSPAQIAGDHGQAVLGMVRAFNELRKQNR